jgi:hypothetical protein
LIFRLVIQQAFITYYPAAHWLLSYAEQQIYNARLVIKENNRAKCFQIKHI